MTLNELIAELREIRNRHGGRMPVVLRNEDEVFFATFKQEKFGVSMNPRHEPRVYLTKEEPNTLR